MRHLLINGDRKKIHTIYCVRTQNNYFTIYDHMILMKHCCNNKRKKKREKIKKKTNDKTAIAIFYTSPCAIRTFNELLRLMTEDCKWQKCETIKAFE